MEHRPPSGMARIGKQLAFGLAATAAGSASAYSNVTLYGIVDSGIAYTTNAGTSGGQSKSVVQVISGGNAAGRFGLTGVEDLGGGISSVFTLENGFSADNGALQQNERLFGRQAFVGLQTPYGILTFGRQKVPIYDFFSSLDPLAYSNWSITAQDAQFIGRADNSIKYVASGGPFKFDALYSTGYNTVIVNGGEIPGEFRVGQEMSAGTSYASGALESALVYELRRGTSVGTQGNKEQRVAAGLAYKLSGNLTLFSGYKWFNSSIPSTAGRSNMYYGGFQYRVTPAYVISMATYYTNVRSAGQHPIDFGMGAAYLLSKRTRIYVEAGYVRNNNGSNLGLAGFGVGVVPGANQAGLTVGVNHRF
ncbi:porin [Cupriavidus sp. 2KB_15]|uniref:porin n=1 Tax=Cupriavidus sp. 2KB_15 TaxID=3232976 RepID=UPI003F915806